MIARVGLRGAVVLAAVMGAPAGAASMTPARADWLAEQRSLMGRIDGATAPDRADAEALQVEALRSLARLSGLGLRATERVPCTRAAQAVANLAIERIWGTPQSAAAERTVREEQQPRCERVLRRP